MLTEKMGFDGRNLLFRRADQQSRVRFLFRSRAALFGEKIGSLAHVCLDEIDDRFFRVVVVFGDEVVASLF